MAASVNSVSEKSTNLTNNTIEKCSSCKKYNIYYNSECVSCNIITKVSEITTRTSRKLGNEVVYQASTSSYDHSQETVKSSVCSCKKRASKGIMCAKCKVIFHFSCTNGNAKQKIWICDNCDINDLGLKLKNKESAEVIISILIHEITSLKIEYEKLLQQNTGRENKESNKFEEICSKCSKTMKTGITCRVCHKKYHFRCGKVDPSMKGDKKHAMQWKCSECNSKFLQKIKQCSQKQVSSNIDDFNTGNHNKLITEYKSSEKKDLILTQSKNIVPSVDTTSTIVNHCRPTSPNEIYNDKTSEERSIHPSNKSHGKTSRSLSTSTRTEETSAKYSTKCKVQMFCDNHGKGVANILCNQTDLQMIPAHSAAVTANTFSPDGKYLATYSCSENRLSFWQTSTGIFGLGNSQTRCVKSYSTAPIPDVSRLNPMRLARLVWINNRTVSLMLADGSETRFNV